VQNDLANAAAVLAGLPDAKAPITVKESAEAITALVYLISRFCLVTFNAILTVHGLRLITQGRLVGQICDVGGKVNGVAVVLDIDEGIRLATVSHASMQRNPLAIRIRGRILLPIYLKLINLDVIIEW
jgi:hypothetical protein